MVEIKKIWLKILKNPTHFEYHKEQKNALEAAGAEDFDILKERFIEYRQKFALEDEAFKKISKSVHTDRIHEVEHERAVIFRMIRNTVKTLLMHSNAVIREAAKRVKIAIDPFAGISRTSLMDASALIENMLQELEGKFAADVAIVGIGSLATELKEKNTELRTLVAERYEEEYSKTHLNMKKTRDDVDTAYRAILKRIDAFRDLNGTTSQIEAYVAHHNMIVDKFKNVHHHKKND